MNALRGLVPSLVLLLGLPLTARAQTAGASSSPRDLTVAGGKLFFTADEPGFGRELWVSDGTSAGTRRVADLCPGECSSEPDLRGSVGGLLLFTDAGGRLWRTDGTPAGTFALADRIEGLLLLARAAVFPVCDHNVCRLWRTDGTVRGTASFADLGPRPSDLDTFQGFLASPRMFWVLLEHYDDDARGLWVSDGTAAGTRKLTVPFTARLFATAAGRLFFVDRRIQGEELWASDGTAAGTRPITAFTSPRPFGATLALKAGAAGVYFAADDGVHGTEVWKSDGTEEGTVQVTELAPSQPFLSPLDPRQVEEIGGRTLVIAYEAASGFRLFASGGTPPATVTLGSMKVSPYTGLLRIGGRVYFRADDGVHGYELWSTDGRVAGTARVGDLCPGRCDSQLSRPQRIGGGLIFLASDGVHGTEIWASDGTAAGTRARTDLPPGALFSFRFEVVILGQKLFFPAVDDRGEELWAAGPGAGKGTLVKDIAGGSGS